MSHICELQMKLADGSQRSVTLTFEDDEWARLAEAREELARLDLSALIATGHWNTQVSIKWEAGAGITGSRSGPSDDDIAAVLHRLRPFVLNDEGTSFGALLNVIERRGDDAEFRLSMDGLKDQFAGGQMRRLFMVQVDGVTVNSEEMLQTYLNAVEYHRDPDKRAKVDALQQLLPNDAVRGIMVALLVDKLHALGGLGNLLDLLFGDRPMVVDRQRGVTLTR